MGCCGCFELFSRARRNSGAEPRSSTVSFIKRLSQDHLLGYKSENNDDTVLKHSKHHKFVVPFKCCKPTHVVGDATAARHGITHKTSHYNPKESKTTSLSSVANGDLTRRSRVKMTNRVARSEDFYGNKMVNEYVRECLIGRGSYGKVVLHRSKLDGKLYAIKILRKSRLRKIRVAPSQTALTDVMREVDIMKQLEHPHIVNLIEVIDDPASDHFYMVMEYVEGRRIFEGSGPRGGIGQLKARQYFKDAVEGLIYLHNKNVIHGDIKPENLLITSEGRIKIGDFSISQTYEDNNDVIQRSPGTPVFTAPECCTGVPYHGKPADIWALGVTLYCMVFGCYPFIGDTLHDMYDKIVHEPLCIPNGSSPNLVNLLEGLLRKEPDMRMSLEEVVCHPWLTEYSGCDVL
eukprot:c5174_g1_i1 orf=535-1746(+)